MDRRKLASADQVVMGQDLGHANSSSNEWLRREEFPVYVGDALRRGEGPGDSIEIGGCFRLYDLGSRELTV